MSKKSNFLKSATLAVAIASVPTLAQAGGMEKCYGVVKAGKNDCASAKVGSHSCAGGATIDGDKNEWILVPSGICKRLVNGEVK